MPHGISREAQDEVAPALRGLGGEGGDLLLLGEDRGPEGGVAHAQDGVDVAARVAHALGHLLAVGVGLGLRQAAIPIRLAYDPVHQPESLQARGRYAECLGGLGRQVGEFQRPVAARGLAVSAAIGQDDVHLISDGAESRRVAPVTSLISMRVQPGKEAEATPEQARTESQPA